MRFSDVGARGVHSIYTAALWLRGFARAWRTVSKKDTRARASRFSIPDAATFSGIAGELSLLSLSI